MAINTAQMLGNTANTGSSQAATVRQALAQASRATGVNFAYLVAEASVESSLDPNAKAKTSSAAGLFQFIESTWAGMVERHGEKVGLGDEAAALKAGDLSAADRRRIMDLRFDPTISARMGAEFASENADHLRSKLGREPEDADLYLAHFLGPGGAAKFLNRHATSPDAPAAEAFPAAAKANRSIFYAGGQARSYDEIRDRFSAKLAARSDDLTAPIGGFSLAKASTGKVAIQPLDRSGGGSNSPLIFPIDRINTGLISTGRPAIPSSTAPGVGGTAGGVGGDPWMTTLITAQLSMDSSLMRADRSDQAEIGKAFRSLMS